MGLGENKRGQVTIFIIIAIFLVAGVALVLIFFSDQIFSNPDLTGSDPVTYISTCMEDSIEEDLEIMLIQGGYLQNPLNISFKIGNENYYDISYLCYSEDDSYCEIQQPSIINKMESELETSLDEEAQDCFELFLNSLEEEGYTVSGNYNSLSVDIKDGEIVFELDSELTYTKEDDSSRVEDISFDYYSEAWGIGKVVQDIMKKESKVGTFDRFDYMDKHAEYYINLYITLNSTKIYSIENENSGEEFRFAVKGGS